MADNHSIKISIGFRLLTAALENNSSAGALMKLLKTGLVTVEMHDYAGMEKVGPLGTILPENNERITAEPGDLILYQGDSIVIYYEPNTWNFTRLGRITDMTRNELKAVLGTGDVRVTLSLDESIDAETAGKDS